MKLADQIVLMAPSELTPYEQNAREHSEEQIAQIAKSIQQFGFTIPVLADENGIVVAGHGRLLAALRLGMEKVPVIIARGWTEEQRRAYTIADNQIALNSSWNEDILRLELGELQLSGFDIGNLGISAGDLSRLLVLPEKAISDPEDAPEVEDEIVSAPGDIWVMDGHRLICGDSTKNGVIHSLMGDFKPVLMVTDPPYGVEYDADWRRTARNGDGRLLSTGTGRARGKVTNDARADWREAWTHFTGNVAYVWHADKFSSTVQTSLEVCGFEMRNQIIWAKNHFAVGRGDYHAKHEPCWYAVRKGAKGNWQGDRKQHTVWEIDKPRKSETGHSTQKPIECMQRPIENNTSAGDIVYDPFCGSGTTIMAAELTGRRCFAVELNPAYCDVAVRRWQNATGGVARLETTGESFAEVSARLAGLAVEPL